MHPSELSRDCGPGAVYPAENKLVLDLGVAHPRTAGTFRGRCTAVR